MTQAPSGRLAALRRALLFVVATSPMWLVPQRLHLVHPAVLLAIALGATLLFLWWDEASPSILGLDLSWKRPVQLVLGFAGGALMIALVAVLLHLVLPFQWVYNPAFFLPLSLVALLWAFVNAGTEELVFRGYAFERLIGAIGHWPAQLAVALLYSAYHVVNGWSWHVALSATIIGSLIYGLVFVRWRSVPLTVGAHAAVTWVRDLILLDPPEMRTWFGPLALRSWTPAERQTTNIIFNSVGVVVCVLLWISIVRRDRKRGAAGEPLLAPGPRAVASRGELA
jgi:membrane protease YdiL (CAAX protease family)